MDVTGIFATTAEDIANSSIVSGHVDESGNLVLTNGAGAEINAGVVRPEASDPGVATWTDLDIMAGQSTSAGAFWYSPSFTGAPEVVETDDQFQTGVNGIVVVNAGIYDLSVYVKTPNNYPDGDMFGVRLDSSPFMGTDDVDCQFGIQPSGMIHGVTSFHLFRKSVPAMTTIKMQVYAINAGAIGWDPAWAGKIQVRKSW